ncbi:hypothetical protein [Streptococcus cuniculi]|uniref:DUF2628 domain-containing protein n=1 Tax=Streptococcus cuniculi TaxID=1432788 RepID=A0A4Y9JC42_9STRE|nr:hypothetical protein [Streptococcus cuniculi]MBF0777772.1 hypothetical protein [Streptococcus cuniculi]TFU98407.1 hypothetical protein E4T82_03415 [Streptococcus cuniculi]
MKVNLVSPTGQVKQVSVGFSWTALLFEFLAPVFRQDWKWAGIMFGVRIVVIIISHALDIYVFGLGVRIVWGFLYNKLYIKERLATGWTPATDLDAEVIRTKVTI